MSEPVYRTVAQLVLQGVDRDDIAARLGVTRKKVNAHINQARMNDALPPFRPQSKYKVENHLKKRGIRIGGMPEIFEALTPEAATWLARQAVEGMTMAEIIASIITDAHCEDTNT